MLRVKNNALQVSLGQFINNQMMKYECLLHKFLFHSIFVSNAELKIGQEKLSAQRNELSVQWLKYISYTLSREYRVVRNRYSRWYSLGKITFVPICVCKNNGGNWHHKASTSHSLDFTVQPTWCHNAKSEKTVLGDNCKMRDRWLFLAELWVQEMKQCVRNKIIHSLLWITIFLSLMMRFANDFHLWLHHSWKSLPNHLTCDEKIVIQGNSCIILYVCYGCWETCQAIGHLHKHCPNDKKSWLV